MADKFYVLRSGRIVFTPGHRDIEGARAVVRQSMRMYPRCLHQVVHVVEEYEKMTSSCVDCGAEISLSKQGNPKQRCLSCTDLRNKEMDHNSYKERLVRRGTSS